MPAKSTTDRYGSIALALHWITALLILGMLATGIRADDLTDPAAKIPVLRLHVIGGITVLVLTTLRVIWWIGFDRARPDRDPATPLWQHRAAKSVHGLLYLLTFALAGTGIGMMVATGAGPALFGNAALPDFWSVPIRGPHGAMGFLLLFLFVGHVLAALYHQFVMGDRIFARMGLGAR